MNISIVGSGYVGLVTGAGLASKGHKVVLVDQDPWLIEQITQGECPIFEAGLAELLQEMVAKGCLTATTDTRKAVWLTEATILTVGTPLKEGAIDLTYIQKACAEIGHSLRQKKMFHAVAVKSTVVPTTSDTVILPVLEGASGKRAGQDWGLCVNPEFMREGHAVSDFLKPDRILLGCHDEVTAQVMSQLYQPFSDVTIVITNMRTAEMIKYTSNALLPALISFANEIAGITERVTGVDVADVLENVFLDRRFRCEEGQPFPGCLSYLRPGCGFGGSCFPKDVGALIRFAEGQGYETPLLRSVLAVNQFRKQAVVESLEAALGPLPGKKIAVLGLSFKAGTDDVRGSPAIDILNHLLSVEAEIAVYDPVAMDNARKVLPPGRIKFASGIADAVGGAEACIIHTEWPEFYALKPKDLVTWMKRPLVLDTRRILDKHEWQGQVQFIATGLGPE